MHIFDLLMQECYKDCCKKCSLSNGAHCSDGPCCNSTCLVRHFAFASLFIITSPSSTTEYLIMHWTVVSLNPCLFFSSTHVDTAVDMLWMIVTYQRLVQETRDRSCYFFQFYSVFSFFYVSNLNVTEILKYFFEGEI